MVLNYIAGPLIGSLIGYCTNYIAVKMLFYPKKEIRIKGHKLPFTPGAIPKGKPRLAKAIGNIVGNTLITKEDIESRLLSEEVGLQFAEVVINGLSNDVKSSIIGLTEISEDNYIVGRNKLAGVLSNEIADALSKMDLSTIILGKGGAVIKEILKGNMLGMFLSGEMLQPILEPVGEKLQEMIASQGAKIIQPVVEEKLEEMENETGLNILDKVNVSETIVKNIIASLYLKLAKSNIDKILDDIDIPTLVETKVNDMNIDELEDMVLQVMKKELDTIVNLGAIIGFLLGIINIYI